MTAPDGPDPRCAVLARRRGDDLVGTAPHNQRWLLVEQPGPWGRHAVTTSRLDPAVATALLRRTAAAGVRVLLIRRPGRDRPAGSRRWALADGRRGREQQRWGSWRNAADLLELPLDGSAGDARTEPTYLVCAHGRHDACCAIRGRPVAAALAARRPEGTWECSHIGGDRFAANVLVLPEGLYYGGLQAADVDRVLADHEAGRLAPSLLRGRAVDAMVVQAAEHALRDRLGEQARSAVTPTGVRSLADGEFVVSFDRPGGTAEVRMARRLGGPLERVTCAARDPQVVVRHDAVSVVLR